MSGGRTQHSQMDPEVETRLTELLGVIGCKFIPALDPTDFYDVLAQEPESEAGHEVWEENVGMRLGIRIIDQVFFQCLERFSARAEVVNTHRSEGAKLKGEVAKLTAENKNLTEKLVRTKERYLEKVKIIDDKTEKKEEKWREREAELEELKEQRAAGAKEFKEQQESVAKEFKEQQEAGAKEVVKLKSIVSSLESQVKELKQKISAPGPALTRGEEVWGHKKRKASTAEPEVCRKTKTRVFPAKSCSPSPVFTSTQKDATFVPETLPVVGEQLRLFPGPAGLVRSIPDTPEKKRRGGKEEEEKEEIKEDVGEERKVEKEAGGEEASKLTLRDIADLIPSSPVIGTTGGRAKSRLKSLSSRRRNGDSDREMFNRKSLRSQESPDAVQDPAREITETRKVGKIAPELQSEIDKKAYQDLALDFPEPAARPKLVATKQPKIELKPRDLESDKRDKRDLESDSDFESPNLLARKLVPRRPKEVKMKKEVSEKTKKQAQEHMEGALEKENCLNNSVVFVEERKEENIITPPQIEDFASPMKKQKSLPKDVKKPINRWGMEVDETSASQKKRLRNQKQSKIDGFFKNPPAVSAARGDDQFKRISHADTDMARAIQLSRETLKNVMAAVDNEMDQEDAKEQSPEPNCPGYAYVGPSVRGREDRQKLLGFDCRECQEYYQAKLEEGFSKDQILAMLNQCSRHRGLFKPPLTPEKFWDPHIVEDETQDPRNRTQRAPPLRSREQRKAEEREGRRREEERTRREEERTRKRTAARNLVEDVK